MIKALIKNFQKKNQIIRVKLKKRMFDEYLIKPDRLNILWGNLPWD